MNWKVLRAIYTVQKYRNYDFDKKQAILAANLEEEQRLKEKREDLEKRELEMQEMKNRQRRKEKEMANQPRAIILDDEEDVSLTMEMIQTPKPKAKKVKPLSGGTTTYGENVNDDSDENNELLEVKQKEEDEWEIIEENDRFEHQSYIRVAQSLAERYGVVLTDERKQELAADGIEIDRLVELSASGINAISVIFHAIFINPCGFTEPLNLITTNSVYQRTMTLFKYFKSNYSSFNLNIILIDDITDNNNIQNIFNSVKNQINILFIESCSSPFGEIFNFELIPVLRSQSKQSFIIVDNTLLTSSIFNPFKHGADIVIVSLSKYYSGGRAIGGAILVHDEVGGFMPNITNHILYNGIHISPTYCDEVLKQINNSIIDEKIYKLSVMTKDIVNYLYDIIYIDKMFSQELLEIKHPFLQNHSSHQLHKKYFKKDCGPSVLSFKISLLNEAKIIEWLKLSNKIPMKEGYGNYETRFSPDLIDDEDDDNDDEDEGTWCKMIIGSNLRVDVIKSELMEMFQKLSIFKN